MDMKTLRQIVSCVLILAFAASAVINVLFLFDVVNIELTRVGFVILLFVVFLVSVLGLILKNMKKEEVYPVNIITPAKELGILYSGMLIAWTVTYALVMLNR